VSSIWLIRHGQAGLRHDYDALSELGRAQARRLGEHLARQKVPFQTVYSGGLRRQYETAEEVARVCREAGAPLPGITVDPGWNEFDLEGVYRDVAPALAAEDPRFRRAYGELERLMADESHAIHHSWSPCDMDIVRAWIEGRYPTRTESWPAFQERIRGRFPEVARQARAGPVAVFTSAVPIALWMGMALGVADGAVLRLAGVMHNSAITTFRLRQQELMLFSFNGIPHLEEPEMKTFR
jgi:broad specificity phosphatase PhoE